MEILVWGIGKTFLKAQKMFKENVCIKAFIDSAAQSGQSFFDIPVIKPDRVSEYIFEKIIVCSIYREEIEKKIAECKIDEETIVWFDEKQIERYFISKADFFHKKIRDFFDRNCFAETIITGIS